MGVGWVRAAWGGEVVYWCGPLWLREELAPRRGKGGWVGGAGGERLSRGAPGTLTVYCSQARCPLPGYRLRTKQHYNRKNKRNFQRTHAAAHDHARSCANGEVMARSSAAPNCSSSKEQWRRTAVWMAIGMRASASGPRAGRPDGSCCDGGRRQW